MRAWIRNSALVTLIPVLLMVGYVTTAQSAQQDLSGLWRGSLAVDAKTSLTIHIHFTKDEKGAYTAMFDSPDRPALRNTPATSVAWDGSHLQLQVASLSGSYSGRLKGGRIEGEWTQPDGRLPLVLTHYQKPELTRRAMSTLAGTWSGSMAVGNQTYTLVLRFKKEGDGTFVGTAASPEMGGQETSLLDIAFAGDALTFRIPQVQGSFSGTYARGVVTGMYKQPGPGLPPDGLPVILKKGELGPRGLALKITGADALALRGKWQGTAVFTPPQGKALSVPLMLRFDINAQGQLVGFVDSPSQQAMNVPITEASYAAGKLIVKVAPMRIEYTAALTGSTLTGQWTQGPASVPLTLMK
jgi:hypothetical protein